MTPPLPDKPIRVAIIGIVNRLSNGSLSRSGALAIALAAHAHVSVTLRAIATDEAERGAITDVLAAHGISSQMTVRPDDDSAPMRLGDTLDIWGLFAHDIVILDTDDAPLRAWLTDLPAHTAPGVRILGTLDYVANDGAIRDSERDIALRFDAIVGTVEQARLLFEPPHEQNPVDIADAIGNMMRGANLRTAAIYDRAGLAIAALDEPKVTVPISGEPSREALIAALAVAMARRAPWDSVSNLLQP